MLDENVVDDEALEQLLVILVVIDAYTRQLLEKGLDFLGIPVVRQDSSQRDQTRKDFDWRLRTVCVEVLELCSASDDTGF